MPITNFWNKLIVHRYQIAIVVFTFALVPFSSSAQLFRWARQNNPTYDDKKFTYGFSIGLQNTNLQVKYSNQFVSHKFDSVQRVQPVTLPGFSLGFLINYHAAEFLDLRVMPKAGFYTYKLYYYYFNAPAQSQTFDQTLVEVPVLLKYKSARRGNVRMYMVGGVTPAFQASGKNDVGSSTAALSIQKHNISLDVGMGFDLYYPFFKFSPEIRYSRGMSNMMGDKQTPYSEPLKKLNTNTISIYFIFQ